MTQKQRYRKVSVRIWGDPEFCQLSNDAKLIFLFLLTHPHMTGMGAMRATIQGLAAELGMTEKGYREGLRIPLSKGMVRVDEASKLVVLPNFINHNPPENPNVVVGWGKVIDTLPECTLLVEHLQHVRETVEDLGRGLAKGLPKPFTKGMRKQEQYQEQYQEQDNTSVSGYKDGPLAEPNPSQDEIQTVFNTWNAACDTAEVKGWSLTRAKILSEPRKTAIYIQLKQPAFRDNYQEALIKLPHIDWMCGMTDIKFCASIDYFLIPANLAKMLEYTAGAGKGAESGDLTAEEAAEAMRGFM